VYALRFPRVLKYAIARESGGIIIQSQGFKNNLFLNSFARPIIIFSDDLLYHALIAVPRHLAHTLRNVFETFETPLPRPRHTLTACIAEERPSGPCTDASKLHGNCKRSHAVCMRLALENPPCGRDSLGRAIQPKVDAARFRYNQIMKLSFATVQKRPKI
jgi:hypothetical protein